MSFPNDSAGVAQAAAHSLGRAIAGLVAAAIVLASAAPASAADEPNEKARPLADEPKGPAEPLDVGPKGKPQSVTVDLKRLGTELDLYAAEANRNRLASALIGLGVGSALVPSGLLLLERADGISRALVIGMIVGGSAQLVSVPLQLIPTRMDEIRDEFIGRPANVESKGTIREIETEWREAAEFSRRKRMWVGTTLLIVGSANLAFSTVYRCLRAAPARDQHARGASHRFRYVTFEPRSRRVDCSRALPATYCPLPPASDRSPAQ